MNFVEGLTNEFNKTNTENGANAYLSTKSELLDLFGIIGGLRERLNVVENKFTKAFAEDSLLALKMAFYARNCRGGLGERDVFREILKYLAKVHPNVLRKNIKLIPEFGRWDDLLVLLGTKLEDDVVELIKNQLKEDWNSETPSLCSKWLPSVNSSSKKTKKLAKILIKKMETTEKQYRKMLSTLRKKLKLVEVSMSNNEWNKIKYSHVPSRAMNVYRNAFRKHDEDRFENYIESVSSGESKINSSTLYPYDIILKMGFSGWDIKVRSYDKVLEEQWKALPNYIDGENNILVMADTSGSMTCNEYKPIATSIGLAIYFAQRNNGIFKNTFMTFSDDPKFIRFDEKLSLYDTINSIPSIVANTNIERAFQKILKVAIDNKMSQQDIPKALVIISDMEFDSARSDYSGSNQYNSLYDKMNLMFQQYGYEIPNVIFWNVNSRSDNYQVFSDYKGVQLASGSSPSVFKGLINNIGKNPYEAMLDVLNDPIYDKIIL